MFSALKYGITGRALEDKLIEVLSVNPRDFTQNKYRQVDDRPYGGGPGMVMMAEPLKAAICALRVKAPQKPLVIHLTPQGKRFDQVTAKKAKEWSETRSLILLSGRYEGIDERLLQTEIDEEWSIGDYVLSGGELAAMVVIDALTRLLPGALGHENSAEEDSL